MFDFFFKLNNSRIEKDKNKFQNETEIILEKEKHKSS